MITPYNNKQVREVFFIQFMELIQNDEEHKDMDHNQKMLAARWFARMEVTREKKHYDAWKKGKVSYKYRGKSYKVLTEPMADAKYLTDTMNIEEVIEKEFNDELSE